MLICGRIGQETTKSTYLPDGTILVVAFQKHSEGLYCNSNPNGRFAASFPIGKEVSIWAH